jgi:hypothetical protein
LEGGRNSLGLIAGALLTVSLFLPWYELNGNLDGREVQWKVYPLWQQYDETTMKLVFSGRWDKPPTSSFLILQPIAIIIITISALAKTWTKRALGLTIGTTLMMICLGVFVQGWTRTTVFSGLPSPPSETSYDSSFLRSQWSLGIFISGIGLILTLLAAWLEVWRIILALGKKAVESVAKRPTG